MKFEEQMRDLAENAQGFPWKARYNEVLFLYDVSRKGSWDYICRDVIGDENDNDTAKHIAFNDPATALLVADVIAQARERVEMDLEDDLPCWSHLQGAIDALDEHYAKGKP